MTDSSPKQIPPFGLRLPSDLKLRVQEAAAANNRSMNAEIVARINASFKMEDEAHDSLANNENLRRAVNERLDMMENGNREQRAIFEQLIEDAKKVLGAEMVEKAQATAHNRA
jgi:hypothetical protein